MLDSLGIPLILLRIRMAVADGAVYWCAVLHTDATPHGHAAKRILQLR